MSARRILLPLVAGLILATAAPASAAQVEKIAGGLDSPRHLAFGGDALYVAEAGRGGPGPCFPGPEGAVCVGATGAVTVIDEHGNQSRLVEGLASLADQGTNRSAIGPHGIFVKDERKVLVTNGGPTDANRDELATQNPVADLFGRVLRVKRDGFSCGWSTSGTSSATTIRTGARSTATQSTCSSTVSAWWSQMPAATPC